VRQRRKNEAGWAWVVPGNYSGQLGPEMVTHWLPLEWSAGDLEYRSWEI
jgi:hypothetical protein